MVSPETPLSDLFELSVDSTLPIAVVDENQRLLGVVPRVTILASLANVPSTTGLLPIIDPVTSVSPADIAETLEGSHA